MRSGGNGQPLEAAFAEDPIGDEQVGDVEREVADAAQRGVSAEVV